MISIWQAFTQGLELAWNNKKIALVLYTTNLIFAYLIILPIVALLEKALTGSTAVELLLESLDITLLASVFREYGRGLNIGVLVFSFGVIYILINTFFAGGIIHLLRENKDFSFGAFLNDCTLYFYRFFKLFLISLLWYGLAVIIFMVISSILSTITNDARTEFWPYILNVIKAFILLMMFIIINMLFDYTKIIVVYNDFYDMWRSLKNAMMFVLMSMRKTLGLYGLYVLLALIFWGIYTAIEANIRVSNAMTVVIFFVVSQIYVLIKMFIRLSFYTGQYTFYHFSNTALPGMTKQMLDDMVTAYELQQQSDNK